jgi:hypothetical protein
MQHQKCEAPDHALPVLHRKTIKHMPLANCCTPLYGGFKYIK